MHEVVVPKDTKVLVSIINCNRDPALWGPDSIEWKPDRWLSPLPDAVVEAQIPGVYSHLYVVISRAPCQLAD
jgi:cytochrome P450